MVFLVGFFFVYREEWNGARFFSYIFLYIFKQAKLGSIRVGPGFANILLAGLNLGSIS
jgi:hypothetical protein